MARRRRVEGHVQRHLELLFQEGRWCSQVTEMETRDPDQGQSSVEATTLVVDSAEAFHKGAA